MTKRKVPRGILSIPILGLDDEPEDFQLLALRRIEAEQHKRLIEHWVWPSNPGTLH